MEKHEGKTVEELLNELAWIAGKVRDPADPAVLSTLDEVRHLILQEGQVALVHTAEHSGSAQKLSPEVTAHLEGVLNDLREVIRTNP